MTARSYESNLSYYRGERPKEWLVWKDKITEDLRGPRYQYKTSKLIISSKATFNQTVLDIGKYTVDNFNKVLTDMIEHVFSVCAFHEN